MASPTSPPVVLVLGNHVIAERTAAEARKRGHIAVLGLGGASEMATESEHTPLGPFDSYVSVFNSTIERHGGVDRVILAFAPHPASHEPGYIPGMDHRAIDDVIKPLMMSVKNAWYHWRRDGRYAKGVDPRRLVILGVEGYDADTKASSNAVLGFWRSIILRTLVIGPRTHFVLTDLSDESNTDNAVEALLSSKDSEPTVHITTRGRSTSQSHTVGQCWSLPIRTFGGRMNPVIWLKEQSVRFGIRLARLLHPPPTAPVTQRLLAPGLRFAPAIVAAYLAVSCFIAQMPVYAFIFGLVASRLSAVTGVALLTLTAADTWNARGA